MTIIIDLLPYFFLLLLTIIIPKIARKHYVGILFVIFTLFAGFRYGVGWDYFNYTRAIEEAGWQLERIEFIPRQIELLAHYFGEPQLFFLITSLLISLLYFVTIKKLSIDPAISIFVFLCIPLFFITSLTTIRFSMSVAILFFAAIFANNNWKLYLLLIIVAFFTHRASIIGLLVIPILFEKVHISRTLNFIIFICCFIFSLFYSLVPFLSAFLIQLGDLSKVLEEMAVTGQQYITSSTGTGYSRSPYLYATINLCNLLIYSHLTNSGSNNVVKKYITLFNLGTSLMFLMSFDQTYASRLAQPFMVFIILLIPYYRKVRTPLRYVIYAICLFAFVFSLSIQGFHPDFMNRRNCYLPYQLFF